MVGDQRPQSSPMPDAAAAIGQELVDQLKPMLDSAFDRVSALPGNPAERQNEALSVLAHVGAFVGLQLTARLMRAKRIAPDDAMAVTLGEISERMTLEFVTLVFGGARG
jgi:hypothetical protein